MLFVTDKRDGRSPGDPKPCSELRNRGSASAPGNVEQVPEAGTKVWDAGPAVPQEGAALSPFNPKKVLRPRGHRDDPFSCLTAMPIPAFGWGVSVNA